MAKYIFRAEAVRRLQAKGIPRDICRAHVKALHAKRSRFNRVLDLDVLRLIEELMPKRIVPRVSRRRVSGDVLDAEVIQ